MIMAIRLFQQPKSHDHRAGGGVRVDRHAEAVTHTAKLHQDELDRILAKQEQVLSCAQTAACGMTRATLRHRIRPGGPWQQLMPGIYLTVTGSPTLIQKEIAAALYAGQYGVITGLSALRRHGLKVPETRTISVLVPAAKARRSRDFVIVRPTVRMPRCVCYSGVVQYTLPDRAVADAAAELDNFRALRALIADAVQQRRCRLDLLQAELASGPRRGSAWLRRCLGEVTDGIRSGAEGDFGDLLRHSGLPTPMFNARLYLGKTFIAVADTWWPEAGVVGEVDSRAWHLSPEDWERTMQRHARLSSYGIIVLHFTPNQIRTEPTRVLADIKSALGAGQARPRWLCMRCLPIADDDHGYVVVPTAKIP
jgi:very-short-patch-repair endonuclease